MNKSVAIELAQRTQLPAIFHTSPQAAEGFLNFFTAAIRNRHTRRAYFHAVASFAAWCQGRGLVDLHHVKTVHVAGYVEQLQKERAAPTVKQHLAAIRMLFDWLVVQQAIPLNPAHPVRGPKHLAKKGKTPVLQPDEARQLLDSIPESTPMDLRDRALIALMVYSFARIGAALRMRVEDYYIQGRKGWIRLREKGNKVHSMPCHHRLDEILDRYIREAGLEGNPRAWLFPSAADKTGRSLTNTPLAQQDAHQMIRRRAAAAGIKTKIGCHTFRATGITAYLKNGGKLEIAQQMAGHESARTTGLYDRRGDEIDLDEVERIAI